MKKFLLLILPLLLLVFISSTAVFAGGKKETTEDAVVRLTEETDTAEDLIVLSDDEVVLLDADSAVEMALANNLGIKSETVSLRIKNRTKNTVFNYFYPTVSASATLSRMHEEPGTFSELVPVPAEELEEYGMYDYMTLNPDYSPEPLYLPPGSPIPPSAPAYVPVPGEMVPEDIYGNVMLIEEEIPHTWNVSASLNMNLTLSAALFFGIRAAVLDYEAGRLSLKSAKKKLQKDIQKQFYNLLLMRENIRLMEDNIEAALERYKQAEVNYENGLVSEYTKLSARVAYENMKPSLASIRTGYESALMGFKMQLGLPLTAEVELEGSIEQTAVELETESLIAEGIPRRLDIQSIIQQLDILKNSRDITIAGMTPALSFMLSFDPNFTGDPFEDPWFEDEDSWAQRSGMFGITVSVSLDKLLPYSKSWIELANTKDNIRKVGLSLQQALRGAELEIRNIVMNLQKSEELIESLNLNVDLALRAYEMAEEAYNAGNRELLEVQNAELELKKAKLEVLKEQYNYITGLLDLEYAVNATLEELQDGNYE